MNSIDYKQKYLKYKNKYLELKAQQGQNIQTGGYMYTSGQYLFFIPENKKQLVDNELLVKNKVIKSLDKFTTELGNCTRFLRIGSTSTGNNKTIYTNQGAWDVVKRETKDIKDSSVKAYETVKEKTGEAWKATKPYVNKALDAAQQGTKFVGEKASEGYNSAKDLMNKKLEEKSKEKPAVNVTETIHASDLELSSDSDNNKQEKPKEEVKEKQVEKPVNMSETVHPSDLELSSDTDNNKQEKPKEEVKEKQVEKPVNMSETVHPSDLELSSDSDNNEKAKSKEEVNNKVKQTGGDNDCEKLPIPLPKELSGFKFDSDVNETNLIDYVKFINEKQGSEKIGRVVVVEKKTNMFGVGGETRLKYDYAISYDGDKVIVSKK
jgi:hypothetical protein